jgi:hypothetical protein
MRYGRGLLCRLSFRLFAYKFLFHLFTALQLSRNQKGGRIRRRLPHHLLQCLSWEALQGIFLFKY